MAGQQHIIERRVLDLTLPAGTDADRVLEHDVLEWAERFTIADARLFDDMSPGPETLVIGRLEVDLGTLSPDIEFDDLLGLYRQEIESRLREVIENTPPSVEDLGRQRPAATAAKRHSLFEASMHFLEHGTLPHWHQPAPDDQTGGILALADALTSTARRSPDRIAGWLSSADTAWPIIRRALAQFGETATESILDALPRHVTAGLLEIAKASAELEAPPLRLLLDLRLGDEGTASRPLQDKGEPWTGAQPDDLLPGPDEADATQWPPQPPRALSWNADEDTSMPEGMSHAGQTATQETRPHGLPATDDGTNIRSTPPSLEGEQTRASAPKAQQKTAGENAREEAREDGQAAMQAPATKSSHAASPASGEESETPEAEATPTAQPTHPAATATSAQAAPDAVTSADGRERQPLPASRGDTPPGTSRPQAQDAPLPAAEQGPSHSQTPQTPASEVNFKAKAPELPAQSGENPRWHRPMAAESAALPVRNAGAVLLGPFLPTFFNRLEMLDDDGWRTPAMAARAVHLVQYLASGETETPQYELPLAMVMCGLPFDAVLPKGITLTGAEQEQAEELLRAALGHWPQMAGTSIEGLRASFLMREGLLSEDETCWRLRVEPGPFDILLDSLPWPYRTLMLSWMPKMLEVEW